MNFDPTQGVPCSQQIHGEEKQENKHKKGGVYINSIQSLTIAAIEFCFVQFEFDKKKIFTSF